MFGSEPQPQDGRLGKSRGMFVA